MGCDDKRAQALYLLAVARNFEPQHHDMLVSQLGSLEALLDADGGGAEADASCRAAAWRACSTPGAAAIPRASWSSSTAQGIRFVGWGDAGYPELLARIPDAPLGLFCRGDVAQMRHHGIAIVGSRKCSERGKEYAAQFARELAELAIPVVSGMALGIDGAAHDGALSAPGPTVAVLGCGVDVCYPPQHRELCERLGERGLVRQRVPAGHGAAARNTFRSETASSRA